MQWKVLAKKELLQTVPFHVEELSLVDNATGKETAHPYYRLTCPDWVNILALTPDHNALLVKQSRAGSLSSTLEIPGGMVDPGEAIDDAARRELEEETGYRCGRLIHLSSINPNPAIMANTLHMFLALDCATAKDRRCFPDETENIQLLTVAFPELAQMVCQGKINSALAALTIMLARDQLS